MQFKEEIRVLGIDDSPFKINSKDVLIIASFFRGGKILDGILSTKVRKDGTNSTEKIIKLVNKSKFKPQIRAILLDGIAIGGFNIIDINKLNAKTGIPIVVIMRNYPNMIKIKQALRKIKKIERFKLIEKAGEIYKCDKIFFQIAGTDIEHAKQIIKITSTNSFIPEPLRISHIIASGVVLGESHGRA